LTDLLEAAGTDGIEFFDKLDGFEIDDEETHTMPPVDGENYN